MYLLYMFVALLTLLCSELSAGQESCTGNQTYYIRPKYFQVNESYPLTVYSTERIADTCNIVEEFFWSIFDRDKCKTKYRQVSQLRTYYRLVPKKNDSKECCPGYVKDDQNCSLGCEKGKYGANCTQNCSCSNPELFCDMDTGYCLCTAGLTGINCTDECRDGFFGRNCTHECMCENNSTCNRSNGDCNCTSPGWVGDMCDTECSNETYGLYCKETCFCNENETCDHVTGICTCKPGWKGNNCSQECDSFTFGYGCNEICTCDRIHAESCDKVTGQCHCRDGYIGNCSEECPFGLYGAGCNDNCSDICTGTRYCDHVNGTCICISKKGQNCSEECDYGYYGLNCKMDCQCNASYSNGSCSSSGQCSCLAGWTGRKCEQECPSGLYGPNCEGNCTDECTGTTHCDRFNGTCICIHRKGVNCTEECDEGNYGHDCKSPCQCGNHSNSNGSCDSTGKCICEDGWVGPKCEDFEGKNETSSVKLSEEPLSFIEENLLYIIIAVITLLLLVVAIVIAFCWRKKTTQKRDKKYRESLDDNVQENPSYNSCSKETLPLSHCNSAQKLHMYEDAVLENEISIGKTSNNVSNVDKTARDTDNNHVKENGTRTCVETNINLDNTEDDYSVPDKDTDVNKHANEEHLKDGVKPSHEEEVYDSTQDNVLTKENIPNEYNTFQDVIKIQQEARRKESETEEDYDTICRTESHKKEPENHEHYSSFEQVRQLSRQDSVDEEDTYNALNEHLHEHRSALVNDSRYHHISLKDKTVDGETFALVTPSVRLSTQRQLSSDKQLAKQRSLLDSDSIREEPEQEHGADNNITDNSNTDEILEEDTEVIYDECDIDDVIEEQKGEKSKLLSESGVDRDKNARNITEIVYEECNEAVDEHSRPPSSVVYEDVDEDEDNKHDNEDANGEEKQESQQDKLKPHVKRAVDRRREDYEDFEL